MAVAFKAMVDWPPKIIPLSTSTAGSALAVPLHIIRATARRTGIRRKRMTHGNHRRDMKPTFSGSLAADLFVGGFGGFLGLLGSFGEENGAFGEGALLVAGFEFIKATLDACP